MLNEGQRKKRFLAGLALLPVVLAAGAILVAASGFYNVAADAGHPGWMNAFLKLGLGRSVALRAKFVDLPELHDEGAVALGAAHYSSTCAICHGAPGERIDPVFAQMLPAPPDLQGRIDDWSDEELFWIVDHGLQFAGMPAWPAPGRPHEVMATVAFLRKLPGLDAAAYHRLASGNATSPPRRHLATNTPGIVRTVETTCAACHDTPRAPPLSQMVPRLGGQKKAYLVNMLEAYRDGDRESGFMRPVAANLSDDEIDGLAEHYSMMNSPGFPAARDKQLVAEGKTIAVAGMPGTDVPACTTCHAAGSRSVYPRLDGQSAAYIERQLELWQQGYRDETATGDIMSELAHRLDVSQRKAVAAYFASRSPPQGAGR